MSRSASWLFVAPGVLKRCLVFVWTPAILICYSLRSSLPHIGIGGHLPTRTALFQEVAFLTCLGGSLCGVSSLDAMRSVLARLPSARRWRVEATTLVAASVTAVIGTLVASTLVGPPGRPLLPLQSIGPALLLGGLFVNSVGLALLHIGTLSVAVRPVFLAALTWLLPALAPEVFARSALAAWARHAPTVPAADLRPTLALALGPILGWLAVALLLGLARNGRK